MSSLVLPLLLLTALLANCYQLTSAAATCALTVKNDERKWMEVCEPMGSSELKCRARKVDTNPSMGYCSDVLQDDFCPTNIYLDIFASHKPIKTRGKCNYTETTLVVNVDELARNDTSLVDGLRVGTLKVVGVSERNHLRDIEHIRSIIPSMSVEHFHLDNVGEDNRTKHNRRFPLKFADLKSVSISNMHMTGLYKGGIEFRNVARVSIENLRILNSLDDSSITWHLSDPCPKGIVEFNLTRFGAPSAGTKFMRLENRCQRERFQLRLYMENIGQGDLLYKETFGDIFAQVFETESAMIFTHPPIQCCHEQSAWLFTPAVVSNDKLLLNMNCLDLGRPLEQYNESTRNQACRVLQPSSPGTPTEGTSEGGVTESSGTTEATATATATPAPTATTSAPPSEGLPVLLIVIGLIAFLILILVAVFIYLRIAASKESKPRPRRASQMGASKAAPSAAGSKTTGVIIPSASIPSVRSKIGAGSPRRSPGAKSVKSSKSVKSGWISKRLARGRSKRGSPLNSPSAVKSVRSGIRSASPK